MRTEKIGGDKLEFDWGSCQYDEAAEIYHKLLSKQLIETDIVESKRIENPDIVALRNELRENLDVLEEADRPKAAKEIDNAVKPEDFFEIAKHLAFDLWSAMFIADYFVEYDIKKEIETATFGPVLNQMAQGENFLVGVLAYLLTKYYDTPEDAFVGFDT